MQKFIIAAGAEITPGTPAVQELEVRIICLHTGEMGKELWVGGRRQEG